jgi:hypothetical protein
MMTRSTARYTGIVFSGNRRVDFGNVENIDISLARETYLKCATWLSHCFIAKIFGAHKSCSAVMRVPIHCNFGGDNELDTTFASIASEFDMAVHQRLGCGSWVGGRGRWAGVCRP